MGTLAPQQFNLKISWKTPNRDKELLQLEYITTLLDSMRLTSLSVVALVPSAMTKLRRYLVFFPFKIISYLFFNNEGF